MRSATYRTMALFAFMSVVDSTSANLEIELKQQKADEDVLKSQLEMARRDATTAYNNAKKFYGDDPIMQAEKIKNLGESSIAWDNFIEKTCLFESIESLGTRAEETSKLNCLIKKYKSKAEYYLNSL